MELTIKERLQLMSILPPRGNIVTLRVVQELKSELSFTEDELDRFKIVQTDSNNVRWDASKNDVRRNIDIGKAAHGVIMGSLKELNDRSQLPLECLDLYERFVENPPKVEECVEESEQ